MNTRYPLHFEEVEFRRALVEYLKYWFPDATVVNGNQNQPEPKQLNAGEEMFVIFVERVEKVGTDYLLSSNGDVDTWRGDRIVRVSIELFSPKALTLLTNLRDWGETSETAMLLEKHNLGEMRPTDEPIETSRTHGSPKIIESAEYAVPFVTTVDYIDNQGRIESGTIDGKVDTLKQERDLSIPFALNP